MYILHSLSAFAEAHEAVNSHIKEKTHFFLQKITLFFLQTAAKRRDYVDIILSNGFVISRGHSSFTEKKATGALVNMHTSPQVPLLWQKHHLLPTHTRWGDGLARLGVGEREEARLVAVQHTLLLKSAPVLYNGRMHKRFPKMAPSRAWGSFTTYVLIISLGCSFSCNHVLDQSWMGEAFHFPRYEILHPELLIKWNIPRTKVILCGKIYTGHAEQLENE